MPDKTTPISIHVPAWGTTEAFEDAGITAIFQSTFPRGERQLEVLTVFSTERISIHVPAWGTTKHF